MNAKNLLAVVLLLFVAAAVVTIVVRERGNESLPDAAVETGADVQLPTNGLVAYYFHGKTRCPTCRKIETYAHEAIQAGFPEELSTDEVEWRVVDYETPANAHFATDFEIIASTVVLARYSQGQQVDWRNLMGVWELVGDKEAFLEYVQEQAKELLAKTGG